MKPNLNLSIGFLNIGGINDTLLGCKLKQLNNILKCDIEVLAETWGDCKCYDIEGYNFYKTETRKDLLIKKGRSSGGVIIYYKKYLEKLISNIKQTPNYIWIELNKKIFHNLDKNLKLCAIYNPPKGSRYHNASIMEEIALDILEGCQNDCPILLIGDLNGRISNIKDYSEKDKNEITNFLIEDNHPRSDRKNCDLEINQEGTKIINLVNLLT